MTFTPTDIAGIINAGGTVTDAYTDLRERLSDYLHPAQTARDELLEKITDPATPIEIIHELRARALAEATDAPRRADIDNAVTRELEAALRREYATTAEKNYNHLAKQWNDTARKFTQAHEAAPATSDPASLITQDAKTREAWVLGQSLALTLSSELPLLITAAKLAGATLGHDNDSIGIVITADGLHRRRIWEAWTGENRWTELLNLGATLHAKLLDQYEKYAEPKPLEWVQVHSNSTGVAGFRQVQLDPEDLDYTEQIQQLRGEPNSSRAVRIA